MCLLKLIQWYPGLFDDINGELFLHSDFKVIGDCPMLITQWSNHYDITPYRHLGGVFQFRLIIPLDMNDLLPRILRVSKDIILSNEVCLKLYAYDITIDGYDREAIVRKHTIDNILR